MSWRAARAAAAKEEAMAFAEAQEKAKTIAEAQAKAAAEEVAKEIAKEQAAHAAMAAAEVAKAISEAKDWFWIPEARETEATTAPPQLCNGERQRLFPPTLMFQQEPGDPPDVSVLSSKPKPQDSTQEVNIPSFETRFKETPDASVEDTGTLASATEGPKVVPLDVSVEGPGTLAPTIGGAKTRAFDAGTTIPRSSDAKSLEARQRGGKHVQAKHLGGDHVVQDLLIEQEPWEPPDMLVFSNKLPLQPAKHGQPQPQRGRGVGHRRLCLRRRHRQTMVRHRRHRQHPQYWRRQPHRQRMNTCTVNAMWATSSPMSAPLRPCGRPFRHHLHHHRRRDKLIAGMGTTSSPKSRSLMPYGWFFHQHLHRQAGNGSLPPSAPKTPPTYAQKMSHTRNGSLPPSAPKTPPKTSCTGNGSLPPSAPKTPPTYTQMTASTESDRSQTTDSIISETTREAYKQTSVITRLLYIVLYHFVHLVIVLYNHVRVWGELCSEPHIV